MALKYCEQHDIWYDYKEGCPECGKVGRIAGSIIGNIIGATVVGSIKAGKAISKAIKKNSVKQKPVKQEPVRHMQPCTSIQLRNVNSIFDVKKDGEAGMIISVDFTVFNAMSQQVLCVAYFYDDGERPIMDCNGKFCTIDGQVSVSKEVVPNCPQCDYRNVQLFIPYSEIHVSKGEHSLLYCLNLFVNGQRILCSNFYGFTLTTFSDYSKNTTESSPKVTILSVSCEHNVQSGYATVVNGNIGPVEWCMGMNINIHCVVENAMSKEIGCTAYFYDSNQKPLYTDFGNRTTDGQIASRESFEADSQHFENNELSLHVPYKAFRLPAGVHHLLFCFDFYVDNEFVSGSEFYSFSYTAQ